MSCLQFNPIPLSFIHSLIAVRTRVESTQIDLFTSCVMNKLRKGVVIPSHTQMGIFSEQSIRFSYDSFMGNQRTFSCYSGITYLVLDSSDWVIVGNEKEESIIYYVEINLIVNRCSSLMEYLP